MIEVYKEQNELLRTRLLTAETELKATKFTEDLFSMREVDPRGQNKVIYTIKEQQDLTANYIRVKQQLCNQQEHLKFIHIDYKA